MVHDKGGDEKDAIAELADLNYRSSLCEYGRCPGGAVIEEGGVLLVAGPHRHAVANGVVRVDPSLEPREVLDRAETFFSRREVDFSVIAHADPEDLPLIREALERGLLEALSLPAMVLDKPVAPPQLPRDTQLQLIEDESETAQFIEIAARAWETYSLAPAATEAILRRFRKRIPPNVRLIEARVGGEPKAGALMLLSHGIAGLYWVSTDPGMRRHGLAGACVRALSNEAFALGARFVTLQATPMGRPIYERMGYREIFDYRMFVRVSEASF